MIKFIHKKHINKPKSGMSMVIYYSISDIFLGLMLFGLVCFFAVNYVKDHVYGSNACFSYNSFPGNYLK